MLSTMLGDRLGKLFCGSLTLSGSCELAELDEILRLAPKERRVGIHVDVRATANLGEAIPVRVLVGWAGEDGESAGGETCM